MLEDGGDDVRVFDAGDNMQLGAALGASLYVNGEDPFQPLHPGHGCPWLVVCLGLASRHDVFTLFAVWGEHTVEAGEVQTRTRHQRGQAGNKVERVEHDMGGAVAKRPFEFVDDLATLIGGETLVGDGGSGDVTAELFQLVALVGFAAGGGMEREAGLTPRWMEALVLWTNAMLEVRELHPLIIVAIFVVVFLAIHPFQDGNGRLSRVLTTLLLLRAGYEYVPYSSLESVIERSKEAYYLALRNTQSTIGYDAPRFQKAFFPVRRPAGCCCRSPRPQAKAIH